MTVLWINLFLVFIFAFFGRYSTAVNGATTFPVSIKPHKLLVFGSLLSIVLVSGLRSNIGDTYFYMHSYNISQFTWDSVISQHDIGFGILQMMLKNYISMDPQILIFTTALITNLLIVSVLYKYSRMLEMSLYVYITGGLYLVSMNGIRQLLAASIIFTATKYLIDGNWPKYFLIVIIASFFHQSALILFPIYFLVRSKAWSKSTSVLIILALIIVVGFDQFSSILFTAIEDTQYGHYKDFAEGGANILRVAVELVPIIIAYLGRDKLREIFPDSDVIVNMALLGLVFMLISTQNWIFARFSIYFSLYQLILISWIIKVFKKKDRKIIYLGIVSCYFLYYFYENVISLNILYESDYLSW
ncbi:EpsG family protein [Rossellomorea vietnamensis]|uniref:Capsular biosynthesis protein n=1 Tax=Rossellomorea vietnamensis TaxID=218284 RepID=A0A0P6VXV3_9BACI|nr:EpsG family protein [Rossellomorea vietnamensis]KPL57769.1 capsular biosynthesis protein [Rossellomorea vietnamensis]